MNFKVQIPADPIAVERNEAEISKYQQSAEHTLQLVQDIISEFQMLELGDPTAEEVTRIIKEGAEKLIREKVAGNEPVKVGGITLNVKKLQEMVEIPNLRHLETAIERTRDHDHMTRDKRPFNLATVTISTGKVEINQEAMEEHTKRHTSWLTTEAEKESYLILKAVSEGLEYLGKKYNHSFISNELQFPLRQVREGMPSYVVTRINHHIIQRLFGPRGY